MLGVNITILNNISSIKNIEFLLLLLIEIFSIICTLYLLIYFLFHWRFMVIKSLPNQSIVLLIIVSFLYIIFDLPFTINSYYFGSDYSQILSFCLFRNWVHYTLICNNLYLVATSSIQRYFLLFKIHLLRKRQTRWILHYIPLISCIIYPPIFYLITIIFYSCTSTDIINSQYCTTPCYFQNSILLIIDCIIHYILPLIITISANIVLICWMIHLRCDLNIEQMYLWKRQKKLISQILIFSLFYIIGWLPSTIVFALNAFSLNKLDQYGSVVVWLNYMSYFICPLQPFICLILVPEPIYFLQDTLRQLLRKAMMRTSVITVEA
ncbi:unnamed protein product [Adineta steineri]|uniref:G-protein coupled receptors family 1 profile domain-containing protein n=1 Tax=Adineta steineri TaxID=433720 RepID=A0A815LQL5_9BILA|nr:unnamed protein product [Adineta steineri]CAF1618203.1 unnamed protein product [Adineta steineri]